MTDAFQGFDTRLKTINRKRTRLERGYVSKVGKDGLIIFRPKRRKGGIPLRGLIYLVAGFVFFKAVIIAHLGGPLYGERVAQLAEGSIVEQAGAVVMQPDPLSVMLAAKIRPALR
ncbi:hypothetical protein [uncultured Roseovarius sp.]|uniref:hypothetical protein n=1 Tax=uncultured Roseovarius sp. TaxID=293344 RepID=UPI00260FC275|nr:hypothetical protein [uncultured Roseovarius sp.]